MPLDQKTDPLPGHRIHPLDVFTEDQALSGTRLQITTQNIDGCRFTGTVFSQQAEDTPSRNRKTEIFINHPIAVIVRQITTLYDIFHNFLLFCN